MAIRDGVHLITYADRLAGDLRGLHSFLGEVGDAFAGVHVLPCYVPYDGADAGFDPADHRTIDPRLGTWDDIRRLHHDRQVTMDVIVNHMSSAAAEYADWAALGEHSAHDGLFLTYDRVFPDGATSDELCTIYRPRPGLPFTPATIGGRRRLVWTTFESTQIDLDVANAKARSYLADVFARVAAAGVSVVRFDAVGYAIKRAGTSCFCTDETWAFVAELVEEAHEHGLTVLGEVHAHHQDVISASAYTDAVYDFLVPPLVLWAFCAGDPAPYARWLERRPANMLSVLDTHDGISIVDAAGDATRPGLLHDDDLGRLTQWVYENAGPDSRRATRPIPWASFPYQLNTTFFEACGRDVDRYSAARALQYFAGGPAHCYYVGALAGTNDVARLAATQVGRDINRHAYGEAELPAALASPAARAQLALARLRSTHAAFAGAREIVVDGPVIEIAWRAGDAHASLSVDTARSRFAVEWSDGGATRSADDTASLAAHW